MWQSVIFKVSVGTNVHVRQSVSNAQGNNTAVESLNVLKTSRNEGRFVMNLVVVVFQLSSRVDSLAGRDMCVLVRNDDDLTISRADNTSSSDDRNVLDLMIVNTR